MLELFENRNISYRDVWEKQKDISFRNEIKHIYAALPIKKYETKFEKYN